MVMNRWLSRVYLTLAALCVIVAAACGSVSSPIPSNTLADTAGSHSPSIWHQKEQIIWPGAYGVPQHGYCMSDGEPAISYVDVANTDLYFCQSFDADGTSDGTLYEWDTPVLIDNAATTLGASSLMADNNYVYVAYQRDGDLYYAQGSDLHGTSWYTPILVDSGTGSNTGQFPVLMDVNGTKAIAYVDGDTNSLMYVRYQAGYGWLSPQTIISGGVSSTPISLAIINGQPAIAYLDSSNSDVCYIRASNSSGSSWPSVNPLTPVPVIVEGSPDGPTGVSLIETQPGGSSSRPLVFFKGTQTFGPTTLYEVQCRLGSNQNGTSFGSAVLVALSLNDDFGDEFSACLQDNGYPAVAYQGDLSSSWGHQRLSRASSASGSAWNTAQLIDGGVNSGHEPSMLLVNGKLGISFNEQGYGYICFSSATDTIGANDGLVVPVCTSALTNWSLPGPDPDLAFVDSKPAFAFNYLGTMAYKRALDTAGESWLATPSHITIGSSSTVGSVGDIVLLPDHSFPISINPSIAYIDTSDSDLYFARASDNQGGTWPTPSNIASGTYDGDVSMTNVGLGVGIVYYDRTNDALKYTTGDGIGGTWATTTVDPGTNSDIEYLYGFCLANINGQPAVCYTKTDTSLHPAVTSFYYRRFNGINWAETIIRSGIAWGPSMKFVNSKPAIAFCDQVNGDEMYVYATDTNGASGWNLAFDVDQNDACGGASLAVVNGHPAIGYMAVNSLEELRYIEATDADGDSSGDWPVNSPQLIDSMGDHVGGFARLVAGGRGKCFIYTFIDPLSNEGIDFCNAD
jgi:hypothetical protein